MEEDHCFLIERRDLMRETGYRLAASGLFADWEGVKRALCCRFSACEVQFMFASPFCRLDIDDRCREARGIARRVAKVDRQASLTQTAVVPSADRDRTEPFCANKTNGRALEKDIAELMANGGEWTVKDIADELDANKRSVAAAIEKVIARGQAHMTRYATVAGRGAPARFFAHGPGPENSSRANKMTLEERILNLMADGAGWMAMQLALALQVTPTAIGRALRGLERDAKVRATGRSSTTTGNGMSARVFERCPGQRDRARAETETVAHWLHLDPIVAAAFEIVLVQSAIGDGVLQGYW